MTNNLKEYHGTYLHENDTNVLFELEKVVDLRNDGYIKYFNGQDQGSIVEKIRQNGNLDIQNGTNYFTVEEHRISILFLCVYVEEQLPKSLGTLKGLKHLIFSSVGRELPKSVSNLVNLKTLVLFGTFIKSFPDLISSLVNLKELMISISNITMLPDSIGNLIKLETLDLTENKIESLPESLGKLKNLKNLYLYRNKIKSLPESIGKLEALNELDLGYNELESLPHSISKLSNLKTLNLDRNNLELPFFLEDLYMRPDMHIKLDGQSRYIHPRLLFSQSKGLRKEIVRIFNNSLDKIENVKDFILEFLTGNNEIKKHLMKIGIRINPCLQKQIKSKLSRYDKLKLEFLSKQIVEQDIKSNIAIQFIRPTEIKGSKIYPMGLLYISSILKNNLFTNIKYFEYLWLNKERRQIFRDAEGKGIRILYDPDLQRYNRIEHGYEGFLNDRNPSFVFIGPISSIFLPFLIELTSKLRDSLPDTVLFAGGYHFGINVGYDRELLTTFCPELDGIIIGDGEDTIAEIAEVYYKYFKDNKKFPRKDDFLFSIKNIDGVLLKDNLFKEREMLKNLDNFPDYELLKDYFRTKVHHSPFKLSEIKNPTIQTITKKTNFHFGYIYNTYNKTYFDDFLAFSNPSFGIIMGSRFCPYNCSFCASSTSAKRIRKARPAKSVFEEMKILNEKYDFSFFVFFDPLFTTSSIAEINRINELCDLILNSNCNFRYTIEIRADVINKLPINLLEKMIMSGCTEFNFGLEKGSNIALQRFQKKMTIEEHKKAIKKLRKISVNCEKEILINGTFILGGPEETIQDIKDTLIHGFTLDLDGIKFFPLEIHQGTKLYDEAIKSKILEHGLEPYLDENNYPIYETSTLSKVYLINIQKLTDDSIQKISNFNQKLNITENNKKDFKQKILKELLEKINNL